MIHASYCDYTLDFKFLAKTSRESMRTRHTWFIRLFDDESGRIAYGECPLFHGLSQEDVPEYREELAKACHDPISSVSHPFSSIRFGFETAMRALDGHPDTTWYRGEYGIPINGLIWMGDKKTMSKRIAEKLDNGFSVLKLKIGGIGFEDELDLLNHIRKSFSPSELTIRLDANGSFTPTEALSRLERLEKFHIHSLEQPIRPGLYDEMACICCNSPIRIALDEELIGTSSLNHKIRLLETIKPAFIILKPALCGGISGTEEWIRVADSLGIGHWLTSALESNVGLEAIASMIPLHPDTPQGLGTGQLYTNNFPSPLELRGENLFYRPEIEPVNLEHLQWTR